MDPGSCSILLSWRLFCLHLAALGRNRKAGWGEGEGSTLSGFRGSSCLGSHPFVRLFMAGSLRLLSPLLCWRFASAIKPLYASGQPQRGHRLTPSDDEMYQKTTIQRLERESQDIMFIESYTAQGFFINGNRVIGPCAILPRAILQWNVGTYNDITAESLTLFRLLEPRIEIVVLGTGDKVERLDPALLKLMRQCGIAVEVQDTPNACATFNFLTSERRVAAAGLIPPPGIRKGGNAAVG